MRFCRSWSPYLTTKSCYSMSTWCRHEKFGKCWILATKQHNLKPTQYQSVIRILRQNAFWWMNFSQLMSQPKFNQISTSSGLSLQLGCHVHTVARCSLVTLAVVLVKLEISLSAESSSFYRAKRWTVTQPFIRLWLKQNDQHVLCLWCRSCRGRIRMY